MALGASPRKTQPDPILTNVMQDSSTNGGWEAPILCSVKQVPKDYARWAKQDAKSLLTNFMDTLRAPGDRANLLTRPVKDWLTAIIKEDAVRVEYTTEDVENSVSPEEPRVNASMKILNVLQYVIESRVAAQFDPSGANFTDGVNKTAGTVWASTTAQIIKDVTAANVKLIQNCGMPGNYIKIPLAKFPGILDSDEVKKNPSGFFNQWLTGALSKPGVFPDTFLGMKLLLGTPRHDTTLTGALSPSFIWGNASLNLDDTAFVGYSPTLNGQAWSGEGNAFCGQFENQLNGTAFEAREYDDPYFDENGVTIVHGNVRRSDPVAMNPSCVFAITEI